jgi:hypothetical protein
MLYELHNYGVRSIKLEWLREYLNNRYQFTYINNAKSCLIKVTCAVPQSSVLGSLLLLIYMNDIANVLFIYFIYLLWFLTRGTQI